MSISYNPEYNIYFMLGVVRLVETILAGMRVSHNAESVLSLLRERSGLLVGPGLYSFVHKSVAEYLVAEAVVQADRRDPAGERIDRFRLFEHRSEDRWNTITFLWAGLAPKGDVESFVNECITSRDYALAFGIVSDQYERLASSFIQAVFSRLWTTPIVFPASEVSKGLYRCIGPAACNTEEPMMFVRLRGLGGMPFLHNALRRAARDGLLNFSDVGEAGTELRGTLLLACGLNVSDVRDWKEWLNNAISSNPDSRFWPLYCVEILLWNYIKDGKPADVREFVRALCEVSENVRGLVPLSIMSLISSQLALAHPAKYEPVSTDPAEYPEEMRTRLTTLIQLLIENSQCEFPSEMLRETLDWDVEYYDAPSEDLLARFARALERGRELHIIQDAALFDAGASVLQDIRDRRAEVT